MVVAQLEHEAQVTALLPMCEFTVDVPTEGLGVTLITNNIGASVIARFRRLSRPRDKGSNKDAAEDEGELGALEKSGLLCVGDVLVRVNGHSVMVRNPRTSCGGPSTFFPLFCNFLHHHGSLLHFLSFSVAAGDGISTASIHYPAGSPAGVPHLRLSTRDAQALWAGGQLITGHHSRHVQPGRYRGAREVGGWWCTW
jgi:hypothetical protein